MGFRGPGSWALHHGTRVLSPQHARAPDGDRGWVHKPGAINHPRPFPGEQPGGFAQPGHAQGAAESPIGRQAAGPPGMELPSPQRAAGPRRDQPQESLRPQVPQVQTGQGRQRENNHMLGVMAVPFQNGTATRSPGQSSGEAQPDMLLAPAACFP